MLGLRPKTYVLGARRPKTLVASVTCQQHSRTEGHTTARRWRTSTKIKDTMHSLGKEKGPSLMGFYFSFARGKVLYRALVLIW